MPQLLSQLPHDVTFTLMEKELKPSATAKDLGITWDTRLTYDNHVTNIVSSSIKALLQINGVRHLFSGEILVKIINSLVFSKLYYCSSVWASTSATNVKKIQCVQNFAARVITGTYKYEHITPSLKALKWLSVTKELYLLYVKHSWHLNL